MAKQFHFTADMLFSADDIDDAFDKISKHFRYLSPLDEDDGEEMEFVGTANLTHDGKALRYVYVAAKKPDED